MESFWQFMGSYWWLVFPFAGIIGSAMAAVRNDLHRAGERRHERRLERIRARGGAESVRAMESHAKAIAAADEAARVRVRAEEAHQLMADHDAVNARWLDYELDVTKLIDFPLMTDVREPLMVAYLRAKRRADSLRPAEGAVEHVEPGRLDDYRTAVNDYRVAFDIAEAEAHRVRDRDFSDEERTRLSNARQLMTLAVDRAATQPERRAAYERARRELDGLLSLSAQTVRSMEESALRQLGSASQG